MDNDEDDEDYENIDDNIDNASRIKMEIEKLEERIQKLGGV